MKDIKVLVIIVTYNWEQWAHKVIKWLNDSHIKVDTIIIDNWSTDKTIELYENNLKNVVKIIKNTENIWFWHANNIWFKYAIEHNYDYVYLLNQDAWFFEDTIEKLINLCKKHSDLWIISPFQCSSDLKKIDKNFQNWVISYGSNSEVISDIYFDNLKEIYEVKWVMAAHWFIPVPVIKIVWWFSPTFYHYWEDDNYINRVKYLWYKIYITPKLNVVHDRYNREDSNDKKIWLWYVSSLNHVSNPSEKGWKKFFLIFAIAFYNTCIYKSIKPLKYLLKIIFDYKKIINNKKLSINWEGPFLKN